MTAKAQNNWKEFDRLMADGSYKSAYALAEGVYKKSTASDRRLAAAYHMTLAAAPYQEDVHDSAVARYRALLPTLDTLEKALCHAFLGEYDSALAHSEVLQRTPSDSIRQYCDGSPKRNMTPTAYDVLALMAQDRGGLTPQQRVDLQRRVQDFHAADEVDLRLWHELRLLDLLEDVPNQPVDDAQLLRLIDRYRASRNPQLTLLYARLARRFNSREDYVGALRWCDTAIALAPKSQGGVECANLKEEILLPQVSVDVHGLTVMPERHSLQRVRYRNTDHLWFRLLPYSEDLWNDRKAQNSMPRNKALMQWDEAVPGNDEHRYAEVCVAMPPVDTGMYILLVGPTDDFKKDGYMAYTLNATDLYLIHNHPQGLLLDRASGRPLAGQQLRIEQSCYGKPTTVRQSTVTDGDGRYRFTVGNVTWCDRLVVERGGYTLKASCHHYASMVDTAMHLRAELRTDRPIYRPGDTVSVALLLYRTDGSDAHVADGQRVKVRFSDPNGKEVAADSLTADAYGVAHTSFLVPSDRLPGHYSISAEADGLQGGYAAVRVEEYKQPKFMVTLDAATGTAPRFGTPAKVEGLAASYSSVPVGGARVQYTVVRRQLGHWWWRWWGVVKEEQVAEGELATAADGSFAVTFTPEPDSTVELADKPTFEYVVRVDVTDINGESHPAETSLRVGFRSAFLSLEEGCTMDNLQVRYLDINGNPLAGTPTVAVERLRQPDVPLLDHPLLKVGVQPNMTEEAFRALFPRLAYSTDYNDMSRWPGTPTTDYRPTGIYRITLSAPDADTVVEYRTVVRPDARKVPSRQLLWAEVDKQRAEVGERVTLRLGSRFRGVEAYYLLRVGESERDFRRITLNDELQSIGINVDSTMLGGFQIDVVTVMEGVEQHFSQHVDVPYSHKRLKVEISTFRDKLLPGEQEQWTVHVDGNSGGEKGALVLTMYDDALNSYGSSRDWNFSPWRTNYSAGFSAAPFPDNSLHRLRGIAYRNYSGDYPGVWSLKDALPVYYGFGRHRMYKTMAARGVVTVNAVMEEAEESVMDMAAAESKAMAPMAGDAGFFEEAAEQDGAARGSEQVEQLRSNLSTLAFFAPDLRTGDDGSLTYRFTVPELLTRWNVRGLAVTKDVKIGTLDRTLVTQKPLMVQPNMPRFLRQGDSLNLMAKVVRSESTDEPMPVEVDFLLTDAATGDTLCHHTEHVDVKDAAQAVFPVEVPGNVYVAVYRIIARGTGMSDGEQGQLPVVTNRQAVTVSQALYINGVGEKHFHMPEWLAGGDSREPHLLAAEMTSDPVWLAVKVMPHMAELANPSTLYIANQLYVNSMGSSLLEKAHVLDKLELLEENSDSRLRMNEDVKQTLLQATPWVCAAESEENQMQAVKRYLDTDALTAQRSSLAAQLAERQNPDGGFSWMPEGKSSMWITQQVIRLLAGQDLVSPSVTKRALNYLDREQQAYYDRHVKPYLKKGLRWEPTCIDYLYARSFYGKASTEAYRFYYDNAQKHYRTYENLYTQAQLALIFHRHGDKKEAVDLLRRLKQKSLSSDEMGMYWRDNQSGWFWYSRPVETQSLLIQAFDEIAPGDRQTIGQMQQWLLKQKQTTHWGNDRSTTDAIRALMCGRAGLGENHARVGLDVFGTPVTAAATGMEGYFQQRWSGASLDSLRRSGSTDITVRMTGETPSAGAPAIAWGAVYYQFTDDMDKLPASDMGIRIARSYVMPQHPRVGDRIKVRIDIQCDRAMDYLELVDGRPSCAEPVSTRAGWRWNEGLSYYITVNQTDTRCYIEHLDKGKYWFEYEVYITNPGRFLSGPVTMQCMYAPEFRATAPAAVLTVEP